MNCGCRSWKVWGLADELLPEPLDGRGFVDDEELKLQDLLHRQALLVVLGHLLGQEIHAVPLREALGQALA